MLLIQVMAMVVIYLAGFVMAKVAKCVGDGRFAMAAVGVVLSVTGTVYAGATLLGWTL